MRIFGKNGDEILSVDDWFAKAPPKQGIRHWKDYRSAKELAKSWFRAPNATPPEEMLLFLRRLFPAGEVILTDAYPECIVALDDFGGEQRTPTSSSWARLDHRNWRSASRQRRMNRSVTNSSANITIAVEAFRVPIFQRGLTV
jgi:hypothetical protein